MISYALNGRSTERLDATVETFVADTVRSHPRPGSNSSGNIVAAPLTKGSATGQGVNPPGRRQEDDVNLVSFDAEFSNQGDPHELATLTRKLRRAVSSDTVGVRRLTPVECERLQGLPDDWTRLDDRTPDSRRYSALGDAVTANVGEWIGARLLATHVRARAA